MNASRTKADWIVRCVYSEIEGRRLDGLLLIAAQAREAVGECAGYKVAPAD